jgi:flavin reductase (DIM6/NTAB) family NADH-FMN oxidoreductase RutF
MQGEGFEIDSLTYRKALGRFTTGVTVITTVNDGKIHGMTANAFCSVSLHPPLVLIAVDQKSRMNEQLARSGLYGVSVLARNQEAISRHFGGRPQDGLQVSFEWQKGCPVLEGALAQLVCRISEAHVAGDHTLYIGQVEYLQYSDEHAPLLFYSGAYKALGEQATEVPLFMYDPSLW